MSGVVCSRVVGEGMEDLLVHAVGRERKKGEKVDGRLIISCQIRVINIVFFTYLSGNGRI